MGSIGTTAVPGNAAFDRRRFLRGGLAALGAGLGAGLVSAAKAGSVLADAALPLRIISSDSVPLKSYRDAKGAPAGFAVELAVEVARRAGFRPMADLMPWTRVLVEGRRGAGVVAAMFRTDEREREFAFSDPLFHDEVVIVVPRGMGFRFETPADLAGRRVAVQGGARYGAAFAAALPTITVEADNDPVQRLRKVAFRHLDCGLFNPGRASVLRVAAQAGVSPDLFEVLPVPLTMIPSHMAVSRSWIGHAELLDRLNAGIATIVSDGTAAAAQRRALA